MGMAVWQNKCIYKRRFAMAHFANHNNCIPSFLHVGDNIPSRTVLILFH